MFDFKKIPVKVEPRSGFDKNHFNIFTGKVGHIVPILVDELIPNSTVHLNAALTAGLPPLASDTFMRCKLKFAAFFVPTRIIMPGFEKWIVRNDTVPGYSSSTRITPPVIKVDFNQNNSDEVNQLLANRICAGSLADMLGLKLTTQTVDGMYDSNQSFIMSALPFLAYHRIYEDWYRRSLVQTSIFENSLPSLNPSGYALKARLSNVFVPLTQGNNYIYDATVEAQASAFSCVYADGHHMLDFRSAPFDFDLLTTATPQAQDGNAQTVGVTSNAFSISALRAANSLQTWLERLNISGERYVDYCRAMYGANLSDGVAQRSVLLGSGELDVYSNGIYQNSNDVTGSTSTANPFRSVGAEYGRATIDGKTHLIDNFTAQEHGYLMVLAWLSPRASYSTGISPLLNRYTKAQSQAQVANHLLQNVGNQPVLQKYVNDAKIVSTSDEVFGYSDAFYEWKDMLDEVHGLMRDGESLASFVAQRTFNDATGSVISSDFLEIPENYLNQVLAVSNANSGFDYWCDCFFNYTLAMPLAKYSIPSLQDPAYEHGKTVMMSRGGTSIA